MPDNTKSSATSFDRMRLQVFMARSGFASRRSSENFITSGRVSVNGSIVTELGTKVFPSDEVCVDGKKIVLENTMRYVLLNKPVGYICSLVDEKGRPLAKDLLKNSYKERLYNVGRLDMFSSGLIIFTNDGSFAEKLSHPSSEIEKEYVVKTLEPIPENFSSMFEKGIMVNDVFYKCKSANRVSKDKIHIVLNEGKNREIRNVFAFFNIKIKYLIRIRIAFLKIEDLAPGQFRNLLPDEIENLILLCNQNRGKK